METLNGAKYSVFKTQNTRSDMKITKTIKHVFLILTLVSFETFAQAGPDFDIGNSPLELSLRPEWNDNLNPSLDQKFAATGLTFIPKAQLFFGTEGAAFQVKYNGQYSRFSLSDDNDVFNDSQNFDMSRIKVQTTLFVTPSLSAEISGTYFREDQYFGEGLTKLRTNVLRSDQLTVKRADAKLTYGNLTGGRYISLQYINVDNDYENNDYSDFFDLGQQTLAFEVGYAISDKFRFILQLDVQDDDFDSETRVDSRLLRALAGINWKPSGKSELYALLGAYQRDYDDLSSNSGGIWQIVYTYRPVEDITIAFNTTRNSLAGGENELATNNVVQLINGTISYDISERWQIGAQFSDSGTEFDGPTTGTEIDENSLGAFIKLSFKDYHDLMLSGGSRELVVSDQSLDYTQKEVNLTWRYAF